MLLVTISFNFWVSEHTLHLKILSGYLIIVRQKLRNGSKGIPYLPQSFEVSELTMIQSKRKLLTSFQNANSIPSNGFFLFLDSFALYSSGISISSMLIGHVSSSPLLVCLNCSKTTLSRTLLLSFSSTFLTPVFPLVVPAEFLEPTGVRNGHDFPCEQLLCKPQINSPNYTGHTSNEFGS